MKVHREVASPTTIAERRTLRKQFRRALQLAGLTQTRFAARRCGVTLGHFSMWLNGHRDSRDLDQIVQGFVAEQREKYGEAA